MGCFSFRGAVEHVGRVSKQVGDASRFMSRSEFDLAAPCAKLIQTLLIMINKSVAADEPSILIL